MKNDVLERLSQLGIYSDYYYRLEIKPLSRLLNLDEKLNCVLTGIYDGTRQLVAVTDYRILIIGAGVISEGNVTVIKRNAVKSWKFTRRFLLSNVEIETDDKVFLIRQTQAGREKLFNEARNEPVREYDE